MTPPIQRFRDFESARDALIVAADDPLLLERIKAVWELGARLARLEEFPPPRGLWRFRSMEEANAHREEWVIERIRRLAAVDAGKSEADGATEGRARHRGHDEA